MKLKETVKFIDEGWLRKPKGFRIHFQKQVDSEIVTDYVPADGEKLLDSDVVAWRFAWKLAQASKGTDANSGKDDIFNICVVDDLGNPVPFYGTNQSEIYNPRDIID